MGEAFRQGMYIYVGGILFCIAVAIMALFFTGLIKMNDNIHTAHEVIYDTNRDHYVTDVHFQTKVN